MGGGRGWGGEGVARCHLRSMNLQSLRSRNFLGRGRGAGASTVSTFSSIFTAVLYNHYTNRTRLIQCNANDIIQWNLSNLAASNHQDTSINMTLLCYL